MESISGYTEATLRSPLKGLEFKKATEENLDQETIKPCTIILVDDDLDDRYFTMEECKNSPLVKEIIPLRDGTDLVTYLKDNGFYDHSVIRYNQLLIVLDMQMTGINGFEILEELKADPFLKEVPIIILSSLGNKYPIAKAFGLGADGYLNKPLRLEKLEKFIPEAWEWPPESMW